MEHLIGRFPLIAQEQAERKFVQVLQTTDGVVENGGKQFEVTPDDLLAAADYLKTRADRLSVDYDHSFAQRKDSRAAGWFTGESEIRDNGLWAEIDWTPQAAEAIESGEYRFISPEMGFKGPDEKGVLRKLAEFAAAALTNRPFFSSMEPVTLSEQTLEELLTPYFIEDKQFNALNDIHGAEMGHIIRTAAIAGDEKARALVTGAEQTAALLREQQEVLEQDSPPIETSNEGDSNVSNDIVGLLGLPEHADEDTILAAVRGQKNEIEKLNEQVKALKAQADSSTVLAERVAELEATTRTREIESIITEEIRTGRFLPVEAKGLRESFDNPEALKAFANSRPPAMFAKFTEQGHGGSGLPDPALAEIRQQFKGDPVDDDSARVHIAAMAILKEQGKANDHTAEEYMRAVETASKPALSY